MPSELKAAKTKQLRDRNEGASASSSQETPKSPKKVWKCKLQVDVARSDRCPQFFDQASQTFSIEHGKITH